MDCFVAKDSSDLLFGILHLRVINIHKNGFRMLLDKVTKVIVKKRVFLKRNQTVDMNKLRKQFSFLEEAMQPNVFNKEGLRGTEIVVIRHLFLP